MIYVVFELNENKRDRGYEIWIKVLVNKMAEEEKGLIIMFKSMNAWDDV